VSNQRGRGAVVRLHVAHDNFCRKHSTIKVKSAMAAVVTDELRNFERLLDEIGV
jgi:hypothetical protein